MMIYDDIWWYRVPPVIWEDDELNIIKPDIHRGTFQVGYIIATNMLQL